MLSAGPPRQEDILGRYHRSSPARREPRPPLRDGIRLPAGLDGRYRRPALVHADRRGPASNRAPRTRGWRPLPGARGSPTRAASVLPAFVHWSSALKQTPNTTNPVVRRLFRLLTQGWDSQSAEDKVFPCSETTVSGGLAGLPKSRSIRSFTSCARAARAAPGLYERSFVNPPMAHQNHRGRLRGRAAMSATGECGHSAGQPRSRMTWNGHRALLRFSDGNVDFGQTKCYPSSKTRTNHRWLE